MPHHTTGSKGTASGEQASSSLEECIENCQSCHAVCLETIAYGLERGGGLAAAAHVVTLQDCAQMCHTAADTMLRGSGFHARVCGVCAEACERCAEACERFADDEQMKACAEACRECARTCREMSRERVAPSRAM